MRRKTDLLLLALGLLSVAFPPIVPPLLGIVGGAVAGVLSLFTVVVAHLPLACTTAAGGVLAYAFPAAAAAISKWLCRAWSLPSLP